MLKDGILWPCHGGAPSEMLACPCVKRDVVFYMVDTGENSGQNLQIWGIWYYKQGTTDFSEKEQKSLSKPISKSFKSLNFHFGMDTP